MIKIKPLIISLCLLIAVCLCGCESGLPYEKEEKLYNQGIKTLSLFFIDEVSKYRQYDENGDEVEIPFDTPVSMNMWGFTPEYFKYTEEAFKEFLKVNGQELKTEFYIPTLVNDLIKAGKATCQVLDTPAKWFGVTYADDRQMVVDKIQALVDAGVYPNKLF